MKIVLSMVAAIIMIQCSSCADRSLTTRNKERNHHSYHYWKGHNNKGWYYRK